MLNAKKTAGVLLLAGLAAWAYYEYQKMSSDEKQRLFSDLKEGGKKWKDKIIPGLKNKFGQTAEEA